MSEDWTEAEVRLALNDRDEEIARLRKALTPFLSDKPISVFDFVVYKAAAIEALGAKDGTKSENT